MNPLYPETSVPAYESAGASRLQAKTSEKLNRVVIIVDTRQMKGVTYKALAAYLSLVALAQLEPQAEPGSLPSVLALFRDRDAGAEPAHDLTAWDRAYLRALYSGPRGARNLNTQTGAIRQELQKAKP